MVELSLSGRRSAAGGCGLVASAAPGIAPALARSIAAVCAWVSAYSGNHCVGLRHLDVDLDQRCRELRDVTDDGRYRRRYANGHLELDHTRTYRRVHR